MVDPFKMGLFAKAINAILCYQEARALRREAIAHHRAVRTMRSTECIAAFVASRA